MSFINLNLGADIKEGQAAPAGRYRVVIQSYEYGESREKKTPQYKVTCMVEGHDYMPISHYVGIPSEKDDQKTANFKSLLLKRFLVAFNIPHSDTGFNPDDMNGCAADVELQLTEPNDSGDVYNRIVIPRLKTEGDKPAAKVAAAKKR